ncbi:MAG: hypothetical protein WA615_22875 [Bradyrhizobium sp.]
MPRTANHGGAHLILCFPLLPNSRPGPGQEQLTSAVEFAHTQLELLQIRARRAELIAKIEIGQDDTEELRRLVALDRYERYARTRRRLASDSFDGG